MKQYVINHVMSRDINSGIFQAILGYFNSLSPNNFLHVESITPIDNASVYHYHRPHLESFLLEKSVCTVHHDLDDPDPWHIRSNFVPRYLEASAIVCLNNTQKNILTIQEGIAENKLYVIPHGYNQKLLYPQEKQVNEKLVIGIASKRYGRRVKGEAYLFELVKRLDPDLVKFIFIGEDREIDARAFRGWGFEVDVYERLPYRVFNSFYNQIDCLLMCSTHEGGPANIPEALATGTPILSTYIGMSVDYIIDGFNGKFLTLNPNKDAEYINSLCFNKEVLNQLKENSLSSIDRVLTWKDVVLKHLSLYRSIADNTLGETNVL